MTAFYVRSSSSSQWAALTAYTTEYVVPTIAYGGTTAKGYVYECTTAGTSGAIQPTWNTTVGGTTADGTVVWTTRECDSWVHASCLLHYILNYRVAAGDTIYVSQAHAESSAQTDNFASPGTATSPVRILCSNDAAAPPTALATTGTLTLSDTSGKYFTGFAYCYGLSFTFSCSLILFGQTNTCWWKMEAGQIYNNSANANGKISFGNLNGGNTVGQFFEYENFTFRFSDAGQALYPNAPTLWKNTPSAIAGATIPTVLIIPSSGFQECTMVVDGVDLSAVTTALVNVGQGGGSDVYLQNCKLNAGVAVTTGNSTSQGDPEVYMHNCDSGSTSYRLAEYKYAGTNLSETTLVRTGGASDGTTTISWKMTSSAKPFFYYTLDTPWISQWQDTTGSAKTATIEILHDSVTALTDADIYVELEYFASTNPGTSFVKSRATSVLSTPVAHTTSTATWTTTGMANPNKQYLQVSFTPGMKGPVRAKVHLIKASYTVYIDPLITIA